MIKLLVPMNHRGVLLDADTVINLDSETEKKMILNKVAEDYNPSEEEKEEATTPKKNNRK